MTLADIVTICNLYFGFSRIMTKTFTSEFPHVERYFWTLVNQPKFKKVLGDVKQADSVLPVPSKKPAQPKEPAKPKAKEEPKKETKPAEPKSQTADEEEEAPKPKAKNPLDLLPPSKMVLDDWKRLYSNTKTNFREVAIKGSTSRHLMCYHPLNFPMPSFALICFLHILIIIFLLLQDSGTCTILRVILSGSVSTNTTTRTLFLL